MTRLAQPGASWTELLVRQPLVEQLVGLYMQVRQQWTDEAVAACRHLRKAFLHVPTRVMA